MRHEALFSQPHCRFWESTAVTAFPRQTGNCLPSIVCVLPVGAPGAVFGGVLGGLAGGDCGGLAGEALGGLLDGGLGDALGGTTGEPLGGAAGAPVSGVVGVVAGGVVDFNESGVAFWKDEVIFWACSFEGIVMPSGKGADPSPPTTLMSAHLTHDSILAASPAASSNALTSTRITYWPLERPLGKGTDNWPSGRIKSVHH